MNIKDDFAPWIYEGLCQPYDGVSGNGLLYTAEMILALEHNNELTDIDKSTIRAAYYSHMIVDGLMKRTWGNNFGQEGPDDYAGCALASSRIDSGILAALIVQYGNKGVTRCDPNIPFKEKILFWILKINGFGTIKNVFNNENPDLFTVRSWLGRMPHLICAMKLVAEMHTSLLSKIYFGLTLTYCPDWTDCDRVILPWIKIKAIEGRSWICDQFIKIWRWRVKKHYKSPGELFRKYFDREHPISKWLDTASF